MKKTFVLCAVLSLLSISLFAHPHIQKSVSAKLGEVEAKLSFYTSPANMSHVENVAVDQFSTGYARLSLSGDIKVGSQTIPAGEYTVGAVKDSAGVWTMALSPGKLDYGQQADLSKLLKLESMFSMSEGTATHVDFNVSPGLGEMEGRATLIWHFGKLFLAGALSDKSE